MSDTESLKALLITLQAIQTAIRDTAEPGIVEQLDTAIADLQKLIESGEYSEKDCARTLDHIDLVLKHLPSIASLLARLFSG